MVTYVLVFLNEMKKIAVFPGSFDPFTKGHEALVKEASLLFDEIVIAIGINSRKQSLFSLEQRTEHIQSLFDADTIKVISFEGLTVDLCRETGADFIIRGLRNTVDFEYEKSIAHMNKDLSNIETVFFLTQPKFTSINSSIVREIYLNNGDISKFVTNPQKLV